jgi:phage-related holin
LEKIEKQVQGKSMNVIVKYAVFAAGCVMAYFEPIRALLMLVVILFICDFVTGVLKSHKTTHSWKLKSKKLRWSFVKMFIYLLIMSLTFAICEMMQLSKETALSVVKVEVWCIIYVEGLSIIENLLIIFPRDRFLKFMHYLLSVEFLKFIPVLSKFLKEEEKEDETKN